MKICDFGTATSIERSRLTNEKGSILWMAPEVIEGQLCSRFYLKVKTSDHLNQTQRTL